MVSAMGKRGEGEKAVGFTYVCVCVYIYIYIYFFFWHTVCGILVPQPVIEPRPQQWKWWVLTTGHPRDTLAVCNSKQSFQDRPVTWIKTCRNWGRCPCRISGRGTGQCCSPKAESWCGGIWGQEMQVVRCGWLHACVGGNEVIIKRKEGPYWSLSQSWLSLWIK